MAKPIDLTGKEFGILTVTRQAEKSGRCIAWYCDCKCGTTDFIALGSDLKNKRVKSCGCKTLEEINNEEIEARLKAKKEIKRLSEQEKIDWDELYQYVRCNVMGYDSNQSLSTSMVLRLKGLLTNKFVENKKITDTANYSYKVILNTFKYCSPELQKALRTNRFNDEDHRFNFILKIVEKNINTVYMKMKSIERSKEEAESTVANTVEYIGAEYQRKTKEVVNKQLNDLW